MKYASIVWNTFSAICFAITGGAIFAFFAHGKTGKAKSPTLALLGGAITASTSASKKSSKLLFHVSFFLTMMIPAVATIGFGCSSASACTM